jgi:hypothetical protein
VLHDDHANLGVLAPFLSVAVVPEGAAGPQDAAGAGSLQVRGDLAGALLLRLVPGGVAEHPGQHATCRGGEVEVSGADGDDAEGVTLGELHQVDEVADTAVEPVGMPADERVEAASLEVRQQALPLRPRLARAGGDVVVHVLGGRGPPVAGHEVTAVVELS